MYLDYGVGKEDGVTSFPTWKARGKGKLFTGRCHTTDTKDIEDPKRVFQVRYK